MYYSGSGVWSIKISTLHTIELPAAQWEERLISNSKGRKFDSLSGLFPYDVIDFLQCCLLTDFGGKQFHCWMSCDLEETNESAHCYEKISSYVAIHPVYRPLPPPPQKNA